MQRANNDPGAAMQRKANRRVGQRAGIKVLTESCQRTVTRKGGTKKTQTVYNKFNELHVGLLSGTVKHGKNDRTLRKRRAYHAPAPAQEMTARVDNRIDQSLKSQTLEMAKCTAEQWGMTVTSNKCAGATG